MFYFSFLVARIVDGDLRARWAVHSGFLMATMVDRMFLVTIMMSSMLPVVVAYLDAMNVPGPMKNIVIWHKIRSGPIIVSN